MRSKVKIVRPIRIGTHNVS